MPHFTKNSTAKIKQPKIKFNCVLLGNGDAACHVLRYLLRRAEVSSLFIVAPYKKKVRGWHTSFYDFARSRKLSVHTPKDINAPLFLKKLKKFNPDFIFSVYYDQILHEETLTTARYAAINLHPSLLPKFRGVAPLIWAIIRNEAYTGVSAHRMVARVDTGDILVQKKLRIDREDTGFSLHAKASRLVEVVFKELFSKLLHDPLYRGRIVNGKGSYFSRAQSKQNNHIQWGQTARHIHNVVRALTKPLPGAFTYWRGKKIFIWKTRLVKPTFKKIAPPGSIIYTKNKLLVMTGSEPLELVGLEMNHRAMTIQKFWKRVREKPSFDNTL